MRKKPPEAELRLGLYPTNRQPLLCANAQSRDYSRAIVIG